MLPVPPVKGGAVEHWVHEVSQRLDQAQFDITIVSRPADAIGVKNIRYLTIAWTKTEQFFYKIKEKVTWRNPLRYIAKIQNVVSYGLRMAKLVRGFDVVVIHNEPNFLFFMKKMPQQTLILHMHNAHLGIALFRPFYRRALKKVDKVICVSDYIRRHALQYFPEYADKFIVIFNATDPEIFKPYGDEAVNQLRGLIDIQPDKTYLLYVGRLTEIKGVHVLIKAFITIYAQLPHTRLIIAGSSFFGGAAKTDYERSLVELAKPVSTAIIFTGFMPHDKLRYVYSAADMVVLPSVWQDPCPLVVLEAMASGTCLLSTAVGGVPEIIKNGVNGLLVNANDAEKTAKVVVEILANSLLKTQMEHAARQQILAGYTWERLTQQIEINLLMKDAVK
ncbi:MAG: glycosyltransferase family 4 protein [Methylotenera sp.]|nr:glycosyltransferase family 4 protein [Methylotenera sp.]